MNILIICNSYPTPKNPYKQIFIKNIKENLEKLDEVTVQVCYNKVFDYWKGANETKGLLANIVKYGIFLFSIVFFLIKNKKNIDVIFPQALIFPTLFASYIKKIYNAPLVSYVHGGDVNAYPDASNLYKSILRKALQACDYVIVNSKDIYEKVLKISPHPKIHIISPGIDTEVMKILPDDILWRRKLNLPYDKFLMLTAGNAIKRKGFDILLNALHHLDVRTLNNLFLLIITEGPERESLKNLASMYNLNDYVKITGKVNQIKLNQYYNAADVFIFPSREEPLGLVGLEAMAAGTPVIGANIGGIPDYLKHKYNGLLFKAGNSNDLSAKIDELFNDRDLYKKLCKNTNVYPEKYSITEAAKKMKCIFLNLQNDNTKTGIMV